MGGGGEIRLQKIAAKSLLSPASAFRATAKKRNSCCGASSRSLSAGRETVAEKQTRGDDGDGARNRKKNKCGQNRVSRSNSPVGLVREFHAAGREPRTVLSAHRSAVVVIERFCQTRRFRRGLADGAREAADPREFRLVTVATYFIAQRGMYFSTNGRAARSFLLASRLDRPPAVDPRLSWVVGNVVETPLRSRVGCYSEILSECILSIRKIETDGCVSLFSSFSSSLFRE